jgi:two-component system response regulator FixJ
VTAGETACVYVIDDDDAVRDSLLFLLDVEGLRGQGFASADAFLAAFPLPPGGCIVTDLRMPGLDGADLLRLLPERGIRKPVIVITGQGDAPAAARALAAGAFDFIEKPFQDTAILGAIRGAMTSDEPDPVRAARAKATGRRLAGLPERERTMLDWLVRGETNQGLAATFGMAVADVELLRARIMQGMGAASLPDLLRLVTEARRYALEAGCNP